MENSLKDVAKLAGVSVNTASRVINKRGYLSAETIKKVNNAMQTLNYQPNSLARSLHGKQSHLIGLILPNITNPLYAELANKLETKLFAKQYKVILCNSMNDANKELEYLKMLTANQVDGIITGSHNNIDSYNQYHLPIVAFDRYLGDDIPTVSSDNYEGGKLAAKRMVRGGAKRILCLIGNEDEIAPTNDRILGFKSVVQENNTEIKMLSFPFNETANLKKVFIRNALADFSPDGIMATDDSTALLCLEELKLKNVKVPDDVQVMGYDGSTWVQQYFPELSTIIQPIDDITDLLIDILIKKIKKSSDPMLFQYVVPITFHDGQTTK